MSVANGRENIEAFTIIDVLSCGGANFNVVSVHDTKQLKNAFKNKLEADVLLTNVVDLRYDAILLLDGMPE